MKRLTLVVSVVFLALFTMAANASQHVIAGGHQHTIFIEDGNVYGMGYNMNGQVGPYGAGTAELNKQTVPVFTGVTGAKAVAAGMNRSMALLYDGTVVWWGQDGNNLANRNPTALTGLTNVIDMATNAVGAYFIVDADGDGSGTVYIWDGKPANAPVATSITNATSIAAGYMHQIVGLSDGRVMTWGSLNANGQLGNGTTVANMTPTIVEGVSGVVSVGSGMYDSYAVLADGTVMGWGKGYQGLLATPDDSNQLLPIRVAGFSDVKSIVGGSTQVMVITNGGLTMSTGWHQIINGSLYTMSRTPVVLPVSQVADIAGGGDQIVVMDNYGVVRGWGGNLKGKLGLGDEIERHMPEQTAYFAPELSSVPAPVVLTQAPVIDAVNPGGSYIITGADFGDAVGSVSLDGFTMTIKSWTSTEVHVENPPVDMSGYLTVTTVDGLISNAVFVTLEALAPTATALPVEEPVVVAEPIVVDESVVPVVVNEEVRNCKPGYGYGDKNHCHSGPPGQLKKGDHHNNRHHNDKKDKKDKKVKEISKEGKNCKKK